MKVRYELVANFEEVVLDVVSDFRELRLFVGGPFSRLHRGQLGRPDHRVCNDECIALNCVEIYALALEMFAL